MSIADLKSRLIKASTSKMTAELTTSKFFNEKDVIRTKIPMLNIAISGAIDGGDACPPLGGRGGHDWHGARGCAPFCADDDRIWRSSNCGLAERRTIAANLLKA